MKDRKGFTLIELLVVIAIIAILAAILFPVFAKAKQSALKSTCQSNMKQLGTAFKSYLTDWDDTYPTNRRKQGNTFTLAAEVRLTCSDWSSENADVTLQQYGPGWVEGLYSYTESTTESDKSGWKCPAASTTEYTTSNAYKNGQNGSKCLQNTYVMNSFLVEQIESAINDTSNLMLLREFDRRCGSLLRPEPLAAGQTSSIPINPFLNERDSRISSPTKALLHGNGSNILFADGHVKLFPAEAMNAIPQQDEETGQWFNSVDSTDASVKKAIAITP